MTEIAAHSRVLDDVPRGVAYQATRSLSRLQFMYLKTSQYTYYKNSQSTIHSLEDWNNRKQGNPDYATILPLKQPGGITTTT